MPRYYQGKGCNEELECTREGKRELKEKSEERGENIRQQEMEGTCVAVSLSRRWHPGVPSAWAERQTGARVKLKED